MAHYVQVKSAPTSEVPSEYHSDCEDTEIEDLPPNSMAIVTFSLVLSLLLAV